VHAPAAVHDAFRDIASALEDRAREVHEASGYAAERTAEASGEAAAVVEEGRADSVRAATLASGNAAAFGGIAGVHAESPSVTETRLYLESIERSLVEPRKYIHGAGSAGGEVDLWIGTERPTPIELATPGTSRSQPVGEGEREVGD
jgi:membrane protease subunit HflK